MSSNISSPISLRAMGSFHIGGRQQTLSNKAAFLRTMSEGGEPVHINPNGTYSVEQMYVQYYLPHQSNGREPLVFWHGGGMSGAAWETTPDGREGWANYFLRQGWDIYVCDAVERGRSGFAPFPDIWPEGPVIQTMEDIYTRFRIGPEAGSDDIASGELHPYPNTRFPWHYFSSFCQQMVPRWTHTNHAMMAAFQALLLKLGRASIICHSQAGPLALQLAAKMPDEVKALVALEPAGIPEETVDHYQTPSLIILGGNLESSQRWQALCKKIQAFCVRYPCAQLLPLESLGIYGNSHMLMMDNNSEDIAQRVHHWLSAQP